MTGPADVRRVDPDRARSLVDHGALLLAVREDDAATAGHLGTAVPAPVGDLDPGRAPPGRTTVAVCRSDHAARQLAAAGVAVDDLAGGMRARAAAGHPVRRDDGSPGTVA